MAVTGAIMLMWLLQKWSQLCVDRLVDNKQRIHVALDRNRRLDGSRLF